MKTRVLIVYPQLNLGGSTTSLLSLLSELDSERYDVDLLPFYVGGPYADCLPSYVHVLPPAYRYQDEAQRRHFKKTNLRYLWAYACSRLVKKKYRSEKIAQQYITYKNVDAFLPLDREYDVAVGFLEGLPNMYIYHHVKAARKIAWIHIDYQASGFLPKYDRPSLSCFDAIVTVSEQCKESMKSCFPEYADKIVTVENLLSERYLKKTATDTVALQVDSEKINLVTTCRLSFASKALDRAVSVLAKMKKDGLPIEKLHWYIIGDGDDRAALEKMISDSGLTESVTLLGMQVNPYPYLKQMSVFFLPSKWEGKPMAVTEGFILGLPALVTAYASAHEQVRNGIDGMVVENSEQGIYDGLRYLSEHPDVISVWKHNVENTDYTNDAEIGKIEALLDGKDLTAEL